MQRARSYASLGLPNAYKRNGACSPTLDDASSAIYSQRSNVF